MQRAACRPSVAHSIARSHPPLRSLSAASTQSPDAAPAPFKPRITSTWGSVTIPSREEVLRNPHASKLFPATDRTQNYRADLAYLAKGRSGLASRLAQKLNGSSPQEAPAAQPDTPSESQPRKTFVDPTIAERRKQRLEREAQRAQQLANGARADPSRTERNPNNRSTTEGISRVGRYDGYVRRAEHPNGGPPRRGSGAEGPGTRSSAMRGRGGPPQRGGGASQRRGGARGGFISVPQAKTDEHTGVARGEDISYEVVEEGGEQSEPAEFTVPDLPESHFSKVFGPAQSARLDIAVTQAPAAATVIRDRTQWARETFGGDYSRFASLASEDYTTPHQTLGAVKHAQLTLARRKDIAIRHRLAVSDIVSASI